MGPRITGHVAFPYQRPIEASTIGGGVWQDNFDGTYTQLHDGYFVPATGYSYLDLYLMGLISAAEVPDFFILKNLVPIGKDANGQPGIQGRTNKGDNSSRDCRRRARVCPTSIILRENSTRGSSSWSSTGKARATNSSVEPTEFGEQWIEYWATTTGHHASMTVNPR